jgi:hypothetical protein
MTAVGDQRVLYERVLHDASGEGISPTGGSLESLSIAVEAEGDDAGSPYVTWTDARARTETIGNNETIAVHGVYVRRDLNVPQYGVHLQQTGGSTKVTEGGAADSITVFLISAPASNVQVSLQSNSQLTISPAIRWLDHRHSRCRRGR